MKLRRVLLTTDGAAIVCQPHEFCLQASPCVCVLHMHSVLF